MINLYSISPSYGNNGMYISINNYRYYKKLHNFTALFCAD